ncbi:30S ribosomal protein S6 modification protein [Vibrio anguillarum]|uniref:30S ribosomal protein S6 modification protein n=1 Tax=Vibrio anguillarum TaxID=55601 RepID=UPI00097E22C0|nr:30S ribosomal protein S6 modification protein [Vibrio anguillarum]AXN04108.1 30S ribosomal protein S6 modification protein [Vibrio anguillarum]MBT2914521.1 hypothetical protein [Vibrio anguillarum]OQQ11663.1 30S ribosomal protein S6 modification protein [Vibrio anguillarum]
MFNQSKILVWYKVASQKVILGEALSNEMSDVVSLWLNAPSELDTPSYQGYRLSLFDGDGREIANKSVSMGTADGILLGMYKARA